jgi:hypothetical protein
MRRHSATHRPTLEALEAREVPSAVTVHADQLVRVLNDDIFGVNVNSYDGVLSATHDSATDTTPDPGSVDLLTAAGARTLRLSNGSGSDEWHFAVQDDPHGWTSGAGLLANLTAAASAEGMVCVNFGTGTPQEAAAYLAYLNGSAGDPTVIGVDAKGTDWKTAGFWAGLRGQTPLAVNSTLNHLRIGRAAPFGFKYFEVGNEAYFGAWQGNVMPSPAAYSQFAATFAGLAKAIDPAAKVGVGLGNPVEYDAQWNGPVLDACKTLGFTPGFVSDHFYAYDGNSESPLSDADLLTHTVSDPTSVMPIHDNAPRNWATRAADYRALLNAHLGAAAAGVELVVGEFNSDADGATRQTTALTNGLFVADALGSLLETEYNAAAVWNFRNHYFPAVPDKPGISGWRTGSDNGIVGAGDNDSPPETGPYVPYPAYFGLQLASMLGRTGDKVVPVSTDNPNVSAYAVLRADGHVELLLINKSQTADDAAAVSLTGFLPAAASNLWQYGRAEDDAQKLSATGAAALTHTKPGLAVTPDGTGGRFTVTLPAYSMSVLDLTPVGAPPGDGGDGGDGGNPAGGGVTPGVAASSRFATGAGAGGPSAVTVRDQAGNTSATVDAFPGFTGGVRVAEADVNGDGTPDLIVGTGPGVATQCTSRPATSTATARPTSSSPRTRAAARSWPSTTGPRSPPGRPGMRPRSPGSWGSRTRTSGAAPGRRRPT